MGATGGVRVCVTTAVLSTGETRVRSEVASTGDWRVETGVLTTGGVSVWVTTAVVSMGEVSVMSEVSYGALQTSVSVSALVV